MYKIELYETDVTNQQFIKIDEIHAFQDLTFYTKLNGFGGAAFTMDLYDSKATAANLHRYRTVVVIKKSNSIVWSGHISKVSADLQGIEGNINVECQEFIGALAARYTDAIREFTNTDAGSIAWTLIDETQNQTNGFLGFVLGSIATTVNRDRTYEYKNIADAIISLTQVINGFDFTITPTQDPDGLFTGVRFDVLSPAGSLRDELPILRIGETVASVEFTTKERLYNTLTYLGSGFGEDVLKTTAENAASQTIYTRREAILRQADVSILSTLDEKIAQELEELQFDTYVFNLSIQPNSVLELGDFLLGDILKYDLTTSQPTILQFSGQARVLEISTEVDENGAEIVTPKLEVIT